MTQPAPVPVRADEQQILDLLRPFFDPVFYARQLDGAPGVDLLLHYLRDGWRIGLDPSRGFSSLGYLACHPDVAAANINPLLHYVRNGRAEGRATQPSQPTQSAGPAHIQAAIEEDMLVIAPQFDTAFYLRSNPDVASAGVDPLRHYCDAGWKENRDPHPAFSLAVFLQAHPEMRHVNTNPFVYFLKAEGDVPLHDLRYAPTDCPEPRLSQKGRAEQDASGYMLPVLHQYFDETHYRAHLPAGLTPYDAVMDYIEAGHGQRPSPNPIFDQDRYLAEHPDITSGPEPVYLHFLRKNNPMVPASDQPDAQAPIQLDTDAGFPLNKTLKDAQRAIRFGTLMKNSGTDNHALGQLDEMPWPQAFEWLYRLAGDLSTGSRHALTSVFNDTDAKQLARDLEAPKARGATGNDLSFGQMLQIETMLVWAAEKLQSLSDAEFDTWVCVSGLAEMQRAMRSERPVLLMGTHVGPGWSWLVVLSRLGVPVLNFAGGEQAVTMGPNYRHVTIDPRFPAASLAHVAKAMEQGSHIVHILPDVWVSDGRKTTFLNRARAYAEGFCFLAHKFRPILLTIEGRQLPDGRLNVKIAREMGDVPQVGDKEQIYGLLVQRYNEWVERQWTNAPGDVAGAHLQRFLGAPLAHPTR